MHMEVVCLTKNAQAYVSTHIVLNVLYILYHSGSFHWHWDNHILTRWYFQLIIYTQTLPLLASYRVSIVSILEKIVLFIIISIG